MGLTVNTSVSSLFARRQANRSFAALNNNLQQLSSALRINRASDDAAGLAIAEGFRTQVRQLNQEVNSLQSGLNLARTAESGLGAQNEAVARIRELAVQASNGTLNDDQRAALNAEAQQLLEQIDSTGQDTEFNGQRVLDGSQTTITLDADGTEQINLQESTVQSLGLDGLDISTQAGAQAALGALDAASDTLSSNRASLGAQSNALEGAIDTRSVRSTNLQDAESRIRDLDLAQAVLERTRNEILLRSSTNSILRGNIQSQNALRLLGG